MITSAVSGISSVGQLWTPRLVVQLPVEPSWLHVWQLFSNNFLKGNNKVCCHHTVLFSKWNKWTWSQFYYVLYKYTHSIMHIINTEYTKINMCHPKGVLSVCLECTDYSAILSFFATVLFSSPSPFPFSATHSALVHSKVYCSVKPHFLFYDLISPFACIYCNSP